MKSLIVALVLLGAVPAIAQTEPKAVARVNGETITSADLELLWKRLPSDVQKNYERSGGRAAYLETLIRRKLIAQEAMKANLPATPRVAAELRTSRDQVLFEAYVRDIAARSLVSDAEVQKFWEQNQERFRRPERIRARHIIATPAATAVNNLSGDNAASDEEALVKIRTVAQQFRLATTGNRRVQPEEFSALAKEISEDGSAEIGGDLGWFERGRMVPEFEEAAFNLKPGETSAVVKTEFGYHVIYLQDRRDAGVAPVADVESEIRDQLLAARQSELLAAVAQLSNELRLTSEVELFPENL